MKNNELDRIRDIADLSEEQVAELTAEQAKMLGERFGIDAKNIENSIPVQNATDPTRVRIKKIEERILLKLRGSDEPTEPEDD